MKRLLDETPERTSLAALFEAAPPATGLDGSGIERVRRRLSERTDRAPRHRPWRWAIAVVVVFLISGGVGLAAVRLATGRWPIIEAPDSRWEAPASRNRVRQARTPRAALEPAPVPEPPAGDPAPAVPVAQPGPGRVAVGAREPRGLPSPAPGSLSEETRLIESALRALRVEHDVAAGLASLDLYFARFPAGLLRSDALHLRVDGLLMADRKSEALATLEALSLEPRGRDLELLVVRGELRTDIEPAAAARDFERVLAAAPSDALVERAVYGRAVALDRAGNRPAAIDGFADYLRRFPRGRYADAARSHAEPP